MVFYIEDSVHFLYVCEIVEVASSGVQQKPSAVAKTSTPAANQERFELFLVSSNNNCPLRQPIRRGLNSF